MRIFAFFLMLSGVLSATEYLEPPALWRAYDPDKGDFREQIVEEKTQDGVLQRSSYISAYIDGQEVRVYCRYGVKAGAANCPGLLNVHGWMGTAGMSMKYVTDGWAQMSFDYHGTSKNNKEYTKYPEPLRFANMEPQAGGTVHDSKADGTPIARVEESAEYVWYAIQRRVLSYLLKQKEVDAKRIGALGYSYGGTLMWNLGMDSRVKAVVAYFGIGWIEYYRNRGVWMYRVPNIEPKKTSGEELFLASLAPEAHLPHMKAATLWLNGSNDHHGGFERGADGFKRFANGVPWSYAVQARGHHNTDKFEQDAPLWLEKHVLGKEVFWPEHPVSLIRLSTAGVPELVIRPTTPERLKKVDMWYALKEPVPHQRTWRNVLCSKVGDEWVGPLPVANVNDYVFAYANLTYDNTVVVSSDFNAVIPSKLGAAVATDAAMPTSGDMLSGFTNTCELEGKGGVPAIRAKDRFSSIVSEQFRDPKFAAPKSSALRIKFYCTESQDLLIATDGFEGPLAITASDEWQEVVLSANLLMASKGEPRPLSDWQGVRTIEIKAKKGSNLFKVLFADFSWVATKP